MAVRHHLVARPPEAVWAFLSDPSRYGEWVVGTSDSQPDEGRWPEVGASLTYTVRIGPVELRGHTVVRRSEAPGILELEAYSGPLGSARIAFDIRPWGEGTLVVLDEHPLRGMGARVHNAVADALIQVRHRKMLSRLGEQVEAMTTRTGARHG
ncbi:SRPBCC family protein [uncultured Streptomyces sp.]|uniref:SRPBCC family protein n=1 Tax=uncultured Streptomyces sp. TaxID=174707 RepID=UPI00261813DD|nr:SRPBCC family protein [uncultured Streptomyces sp.]